MSTTEPPTTAGPAARRADAAAAAVAVPAPQPGRRDHRRDRGAGRDRRASPPPSFCPTTTAAASVPGSTGPARAGERSWGDGGPGRWGGHDRGDRDDEGFGRPGPRGFGFGDDPVITGTVASAANGSIVVNVDGAGPAHPAHRRRHQRGRPGQQRRWATCRSASASWSRSKAPATPRPRSRSGVPQARVTGTVTALSGDTATVTSVDGPHRLRRHHGAVPEAGRRGRRDPHRHRRRRHHPRRRDPGAAPGLLTGH